MHTSKSFFSLLALPLTLILGLLVIGLLLLTLSDKQALGRLLILAAIIIFILASFEGVPYLLLRPLEYRFPSLREYSARELTERYPAVAWIVVLSGGHTSSPEVPLSMQGTRVTTQRLVEGIRLLRIYPAAKLLLSGGDRTGEVCDADVMAAMAKDLGVDERSIVLERDSRDTQDQARLLPQIVGTDRCILVTSAAHMVRAIGLFHKAGVDPIPAPTDYLVKTQAITDRFYYPNEESLLKTRTAVHEYFGILWGRLNGSL